MDLDVVSVNSKSQTLSDRLLNSGLLKKSYHGDDVMCLHPVVIVNPSLPELLYRYGNITIDGYFRKLSRTDLVYHYGYSVSPRGVTYENFKNSYVTDELTGEIFPVFLLVPCGHCECCQKAKLDATAHRCVLETMAYNSLPWFVTLTYNNDHLPPDGVRLDHIQLFLKRLRTNLDRHDYLEPIRVYYVSEYSPVGRPHYHMIIWNLHPKKDFRYYKLLYLIEKSWSMGFVYNEIVSPKYKKNGIPLGSPQKCFEYVSKYINKDCDVPPGKNPVFANGSNRGGGIGAPYLDKYVIPQLRKSLNPEFLFLNHFAGYGKLQRLFFNRYVLSRCFPTFSTSCPLKLRNAFRRLLFNEAALGYRYRSAEFRDVYATLSKHLPAPLLKVTDVSHGEPACFSSCWCFRWQIDQDIALLKRLIPTVDFSKCKELDLKRKLFVSKLMSHRKHRDLDDIAYKFRQSREKTAAMIYLPM